MNPPFAMPTTHARPAAIRLVSAVHEGQGERRFVGRGVGDRTCAAVVPTLATVAAHDAVRRKQRESSVGSDVEPPRNRPAAAADAKHVVSPTAKTVQRDDQGFGPAPFGTNKSYVRVPLVETKPECSTGGMPERMRTYDLSNRATRRGGVPRWWFYVTQGVHGQRTMSTVVASGSPA